MVRRKTIRNATVLKIGLCFAVAGSLCGAAAEPPAPANAGVAGGRRIDYVRSIATERDVSPTRSFWSKVLDVVAGAPTLRRVVRPYGVTTDSRGRVIVSD